jgi:predicted O-methyltransferase YrrM
MAMNVVVNETRVPANDTVPGAVDKYVFEHTFRRSPTALPAAAIIDKAAKNQIDGGLPDMAVSENQGKLLQVLAQVANAKNILEVGTLGGYSTIFLANAVAGAHITTVEYNHVHAEVCRKNFEMAGIADRVEFHEGSGRDIIPKLYDEFRAGKRELLDFTFIDADKPSNYLYFDYAVKMSRPGAVIVVDNVVRGGAIVDLEEEDPHKLLEGSRNAIERVGADPRVASSVLQTVGEKAYDGMIIAVKL